MRTFLTAALILGAAAPAAAAFTTKLADNQGRSASLRWEPGPGGVRWELVCLDGSDRRRPAPPGAPPSPGSDRRTCGSHGA